MKIKYDFEENLEKEIFNLIKSKYGDYIKIFWVDILRITLDTLSLHKNPKSFKSRLEILINNFEKTPNVFLLFFQKFFFSNERYIPRFFLNLKFPIAWNNNYSIEEYAKKKKLNLQKSRNYEWFDKKKNIKFYNHEFGNFVYYKLKKIFNKFDKAKKLKQSIISNLNIYYCWSNHQLKFNSNLKLPRVFLSATMGSPFNRIMAINILKQGGKVVVFDHGVGAGFTNHTGGRIFLDLAYSSKFITYNKLMCDGVRENFISMNNRMKFYRNDSPEINYLTSKKKILGQSVFKLKKIVFVLASTEEKFFKGSKKMYDNEVIFQLILRVSKFALKLKLPFLIKIHPEHTSKKFLNKLKVAKLKIINDKFENLNWKDTLFYFENIQTSAFKYATIIDKPIVYLDQKRFLITKSIKKQIDKRCQKLNWKFISNKITFSFDNFSKSIKKSIKLRKCKNFVNDIY